MSSLLYTIPDSLKGEIDELESHVFAFQAGSITETELKARRVPFGVYEQRKKGTYMVRVRCAAGIITPSQLKRVAELSLHHGSGVLHVTTRQEVQIHDVHLEDLVAIIRELAKVELSTRGGGGNTVRNITAPADAGITSDEIFDVTPYAIALTSALIARADSWLLPRKYKIAFSHSAQDSGYATVNDLGFVAQIKDGIQGFRVFVAGGMGRQSHPGHLLHDFVPATEVFVIAEAIKRLFSKNGNRKNKHAARLRFLWNALGAEKFIELYNKESADAKRENGEPFAVDAIVNKPTSIAPTAPIIDHSFEFKTWRKRYTAPQKQEGATTARVPLLFGIIAAEKAKHLAEVLIPFGENTIRFTHDQNIALRNIPNSHIGNVYTICGKVSELATSPSLFGNAVACAGASTCQLGICRARGALEGVIDRLKSSSIDLDELTNVRLRVSGCSNTCGQHMIADVGFFGKVGRKEQRSYPAYTIVGGAVLNASEGSRLSEKVDEISARDMPAFTEELLGHYAARKSSFPTFAAYLDAEGRQTIRALCDRFREIPSFEADRSYYRDWGDTEMFSLAGKGTGECSAGLFDLIEIDLARLRQLRSALLDTAGVTPAGQTVYELALVSARMLLITRGVEAPSEREVFAKFNELFIGEKHIDKRFAAVVEKGESGPAAAFVPLRDDVISLAGAVENLYQGMDNSLQFKKLVGGSVALTPPSSPAATAQPKPDLSKDFRGVACPMNFVKTKMALSLLKIGQTLAISLDDGEPVENVPKSVEAEGHRILETKRIQDYWVVLIRKGS